MEVPSTPTAKEVASELEAHERECAVRYETLDNRLKEGQHRFSKMEQMIWGIYALLIASSVLAQVLK